MNVRRSPPFNSGSQPDLSKLPPAVKDDLSHFRNKRKHPDNDTLLFDKFRNEMMTFLTDFANTQNEKLVDFGTTHNENLRKISNDVCSLKEQFNSIKVEIKSIDEKQSLLFADMASVKEALDFQGKEQSDLGKRVEIISDNIISNNQEATSMKREIDELRSELNYLQQRDRQCNLEIAGIPERPHENLNAYLTNIAFYSGVQLSAQDVDHITRIQTRTKIPGRPKLILAKLKSRFLRDSIISGIRKKKGVTTTNIDVSGETRHIYVNEHLTPLNKLLYKNTRDKAKATQYQHVWVRDGKVFVRKDDSSPALLIRDMTDLKRKVV